MLDEPPLSIGSEWVGQQVKQHKRRSRICAIFSYDEPADRPNRPRLTNLAKSGDKIAPQNLLLDAASSSGRTSVLRFGMVIGILGVVLSGNVPPAVEVATPSTESKDYLLLRDTDIHPLRVYDRYLSDQSRTPDRVTARIAREFQDLIGLYAVRQGIDDNFTLRVVDNRDGGLVSIVTLDSARAEYERSGFADWNQVDRLRRQTTSEIVKALRDSLDREFITVKWGRRNEILEARQRELPVVEHEVRLARALNLSLLTAEIGTVETFNNDKLISRVGARSRYQLMPSILRELGVRHYHLRTATGRSILVQEEMHPLISMEAAFTVAKAYSNAMGDEIPGISAYHTGPFNVFRLYERYLDEQNDVFNEYSDVVTAYLWGLTEGFDQVSDNTTFGPTSRNYVPSVFGALAATDDLPIDTSHTWIVEQVSLKKGISLFLSDLLAAADSVAGPTDWRTSSEDSTTYQRFRRLNPHIALPEIPSGVVPERADIRLTATSDGVPVRFFLPRGMAVRLSQRGMDWFDLRRTQQWTHEPFYSDGERMSMDDRYDRLVASAADFSFTDAGVASLDSLYFEFQSRVREHPTWFNRTQYNVIRLHRRVWRAGNYKRLVAAAEAARSRVSDKPLARLPAFRRLPYLPIDSVTPQNPGGPELFPSPRESFRP